MPAMVGELLHYSLRPREFPQETWPERRDTEKGRMNSIVLQGSGRSTHTTRLHSLVGLPPIFHQATAVDELGPSRSQTEAWVC